MWSKLVYLIFILYFEHCYGQSEVEDRPEIDTALGRVRGHWKKSLDERKYAAFEGIPYAKPPVGDLRFEEPQPVSAWSGIWEAISPQMCVQTELMESGSQDLHGSEDCLYLNVYIAEEFLDKPSNLDVVVAIHGGAFMVGSGTSVTDSRLLMDRNIILVTINYRVGFFGFLSTEDGAIPGNNGLKDQALALKWVKDNIDSFGGNPDSVTLVGLSAGGASVHLHYFSPLSKGLFSRGLSQSGTALSPTVIRRNALQRARKLGNLAGCADDSTEELKKCLKQRPATVLMPLVIEFYGFGNLPLSPFGPVVEKNSKNAFLDKDPYQLLEEGNVYDVPWITSFSADDGLLPAAFFYSQLNMLDQHWDFVSNYLLDYNETLPVGKESSVPKEIRNYYFGEGGSISKDNFKKFSKLCTDRLAGIPAELSAKMQAKVTKSPVYFYVFDYREGELKMAKFYSRSELTEGVAHGDDGIYFYGLLPDHKYSEKDNNMRNACQDMLFSFASTGKPSFDGTDKWQPTTNDELTYLLVSGPGKVELQKTETLTPIDFWSQLGLHEYEHVVVKDEL